MSGVIRLEAVFAEIIREARTNTAFYARLNAALVFGEQGNPADSERAKRNARRRAPGVLDPFGVYAEGEHTLRDRLAGLSVEQLKDIVAQHGIDPSRLALKWKTPERLIDLIISTVRERLRKGDAFR